MFEVIKNSIDTYTKYLGMILFFSIPFIISLLLPLFSPAPVFSALGGYFLRSGSIPELTNMDLVVIALSVGFSLLFLSLALVAVTLVVKASRTRTRVSAEAMRNLTKYTLMVFAIFAVVKVVQILILSYLLSAGTGELPLLLLNFFIFLGMFYLAPAIVLEEKKPVPAFMSSFKHISRRPMNFVTWLVVAFLLIYIVSSLSFMMFSDAMMRQGFTIIVNSLFILPFLVVLQAHLYMLKYTIVK